MQIGLLLSLFLAVLCICNGEDVIEKCQEEHNVTDAELDSFPKDTPVESYPLKIKCYAKCTIAHLLGDDGKLVAERVYEENKGLECKERYDNYVINNEEESCDYAIKILECLHKLNTRID
ncbi:uncharacterized protein LOC132792193 [Drosophila nasuta]|uniref:uncharacterized protein LOC132792193 n=1 Tax=Drosophila nasuta TaxID=42062 RepID=UPI00295EF120|nr:uncharacterized protein LOC132792193 [Drosophila nasuta]